MERLQKIAQEYSNLIARKMGVSYISLEQRSRELARCKEMLKSTPEDYDIAYASGLIHSNVERIAFLRYLHGKTLDEILHGDYLVLPPENKSVLFPNAVAEILNTFPKRVALFCPKSFPESYEFSPDDLYIFHCAISSATCRLMEYLEIPFYTPALPE